MDRALELQHLDAQQQMGELTSYYRWVFDRFRSYFGPRVWDAGAGLGYMSALVAADGHQVLATEYTQENLRLLGAKFGGSQAVTVQFLDLQSDVAPFDGNFDTIVTCDVIEHLEDDAKALSHFWTALKPGGYLLIKVPAHQALYCDIDRASAHCRRYDRGVLKNRILAAGFEVKSLRFMNLYGALIYLLKGRMLKKRTNLSRTMSRRSMNFYNTFLPIYAAIERLLPLPCGLSLLAVAQKPQSDRKKT